MSANLKSAKFKVRKNGWQLRNKNPQENTTKNSLTYYPPSSQEAFSY